MRDYKLKIDLLPKGAWNNDFSKTLPKKEWDILRNKCYERANYRCEICGYQTDDLDAHEVWNFDVKTKTQTLVNILALCSKCHGVKHYRNSTRLGYGEEAKQHFMIVNNCSEMEFATHLVQAQMDFEERNKVYRWKVKADLTKFGLENATIKEKNIPYIQNPYERVDWNNISFEDKKKLFEFAKSVPPKYWINTPKVLSIEVNNYQGTIQVIANDVNKIVWYLDGNNIKTKYNVVGNFSIMLKVENLEGKELTFALFGEGGKTFSKTFELLPQEVL